MVKEKNKIQNLCPKESLKGEEILIRFETDFLSLGISQFVFGSIDDCYSICTMIESTISDNQWASHR
jgi:hypothetical protein